jgi:hypothetical protein
MTESKQKTNDVVMAESKPVLQELGEKFKPMEVLALMKGDLAKVPDLAKRC